MNDFWHKHRFLSLLLLALLLGLVVYGGQQWREKKKRDELVPAGFILINRTDGDIYASVHYSKFPEPGEGAAEGAGPHGGGGLYCCVPIPAYWRPGIMMNVWFSTKNWQEGETRVVELPEYPDGESGDVFLVFYSPNDFELYSSVYGPRHPKWPGRRTKPAAEGVQP